MKLLLDTHALLWWIEDDLRLSRIAHARISGGEDVVWSVASLWEIGIKLSLQRSDFSVPANWDRLIPEEMKRSQIRRMDIEASHCLAVSELPWHHRDPFDRMLIAQATVENRTIISADRRLDFYGVDRIW